MSSALLRPGAHVVRVALTKSNARVDVVAMPFPAGPAEVLFVVVVLIEDVDAAGLPLLARLFARLEELIFGEDEVARMPPHLWMAEREATESKQYAMRGEPALPGTGFRECIFWGAWRDILPTCGAGIEYLVPRVLVDFTRAGAPRSESTRVCPASSTTWTGSGLGARCLG